MLWMIDSEVPLRNGRTAMKYQRANVVVGFVNISVVVSLEATVVTPSVGSDDDESKVEYSVD